ARRYTRVVVVVVLRPFLGNLDGDLGWEVLEVLVRPDRSRRASLIGTGIARPHPLQRSVPTVPPLLLDLGLRRWIQEPGRRVPRQHIEGVAGLREWLGTEQRARRRPRRDIVGISAPGKGA